MRRWAEEEKTRFLAVVKAKGMAEAARQWYGDTTGKALKNAVNRYCLTNQERRPKPKPDVKLARAYMLWVTPDLRRVFQ